jgi:cytidylate kinase
VIQLSTIQIAIDGPAASGKSTIAKKIAEELGYLYIDTGSMYRAITYKALHLGIDLEQESAFSFVNDTKFQFDHGTIFMDGKDVTEHIRSHKVSNNVSLVASYLSVRQACVKIQRDLAKNQNIVMDGRDIGYKVLPNADFKFFLTASIETRAERRYQDNVKRGIESNKQILIEKLAQRDHFDSTRQHSPLKPADDALILDTSDLTIDQVVGVIIEKIRGRS